MRIVLTSTDTLTRIDGVPVRLWQGITDRGTPCKVFVHQIAVAQEVDAAEFDAELKELPQPAELQAIPLRQVL